MPSAHYRHASCVLNKWILLAVKENFNFFVTQRPVGGEKVVGFITLIEVLILKKYMFTFSLF